MAWPGRQALGLRLERCRDGRTRSGHPRGCWEAAPHKRSAWAALGALSGWPDLEADPQQAPPHQASPDSALGRRSRRTARTDGPLRDPDRAAAHQRTPRRRPPERLPIDPALLQMRRWARHTDLSPGRPESSRPRRRRFRRRRRRLERPRVGSAFRSRAGRFPPLSESDFPALKPRAARALHAGVARAREDAWSAHVSRPGPGARRLPARTQLLRN